MMFVCKFDFVDYEFDFFGFEIEIFEFHLFFDDNVGVIWVYLD